jgi:hypothetical protein
MECENSCLFYEHDNKNQEWVDIEKKLHIKFDYQRHQGEYDSINVNRIYPEY